MHGREPVLRHSPLWSVVAATLGFICAVYALGIAVADGSKAWIALLLVAAVVFAVVGAAYVISLTYRGGLKSRFLGALALATNVATFGFAVAVGTSIRW